MGYLANQSGTQITLEEEIALAQLSDLGDPGDVLTINPSGTGLEYTPNQSSDEKVKYNASDTTAGYLSDKVVAGTGITLEEGTGGDAGKLKIINSLDLSGYVPYTGATTDLNLGNHKISAGSVDITIGNVESGSATQNSSGSAFYAYGNYFNFLVYAYKNVDSGRVYSSTPFSIDFYDDNSGNPYSIDVSWSAVVGADGYKIVITDYYYGYYGNFYTETTTNSLSYIGIADYEDPIVVTPNIIAGIAGVFDGNVNIDGVLDVSGNIYGSAFIKDGGVSTQFLKADGSVDTSTYLTTAVTSVSKGNGMNFTSFTTTGTITLGTPSTCTASTTNALTSTSHTHAITGFLTAETDTWATVMARGNQSDTEGIIDITSTKALLVRKNSDGGDVFTVDTTNSKIIVGGATHQIGFTGEEDLIVLTSGLITAKANAIIALSGTGYVDSPKYYAGGTAPVADGTYTVGIGGTTNGTITIKGGIITAVQQAVA